MNTILVTGINGQLGGALLTPLSLLGKVIGVGRNELNLGNPDSIRTAIRTTNPTIIVNAAAYTAVDKAESETESAMQVNAVAPGIIAEEALRIRALLVHFSTDYVFDGAKASPYLESDPPNPISVYGKSKLEGEHAILATGCTHLILRTSWVYRAGHVNFVETMLRLGRERSTLSVVTDQLGSPTWADALAKTTAELLRITGAEPEEQGVFNLSAEGFTSRYALAQAILDMAGKSKGKKGWATIQPTTTAEYPLPAARPLNAVLSKEKIQKTYSIRMSSWEAQLADFLSGKNLFP